MEIGLLEDLAGQLGCMCLSDLHRAERRRLSRCLQTFRAETYSLWEWNDAARYLTGAEIRFSDRKEAKKILLNALGGQQEQA